VVRSVVPDEPDRIAGKLVRWADSGEVDAILTTGGTGLTARDVTPEATTAILERAAPGIAEALRAGAARAFPRAWLSRGVAGARPRHVRRRGPPGHPPARADPRLPGADGGAARAVGGAAPRAGARPLGLHARARGVHRARSPGPRPAARAHGLPGEARRPGRGGRHGAAPGRAAPAAAAHRDHRRVPCHPGNARQDRADGAGHVDRPDRGAVGAGER